MKSIRSVALATWMMEHLTFGPANRSLTGDLLEEFQLGRSRLWFWGQVLAAIVIGNFRTAREFAMPVAFSAGWSMLYPALQFLVWKSVLSQTIVSHPWSLDWPYSAFLELATGIVPPMTFIWIGFFVYQVLRRQTTQQLTWLRMFGSFSLSLNVLLITAIGLLTCLGPAGTGLFNLARKNVYLSPRYIAFSIPLALSLFSAMICSFSATET